MPDLVDVGVCKGAYGTWNLTIATSVNKGLLKSVFTVYYYNDYYYT